MHLSAGMMVNPNVRLTRPLGAGAMGCVWIADHLTLKTQVAVKFISAQLAVDDPEILERFVREASTAAQIKSPHVVQTFDQGLMADGTPYIVLELLEGETMQEMLDRVGKLDLADTARVVIQVGRALAKAHDLGIVHRDIKPDNIFLTPTEEGLFAKVLDFGIAKQTQLPKMGGLTNPGVMVGTPEYMSPEQVLSARDVDFRADLWALAVTAYYGLTGALPFTAESLGTLCVKLLDGSFTPPSHLRAELHAGFDAFFVKAMAHAPEERFRSAREMARELAALVASTGTTIDDEVSLPLASTPTPFPRGPGSSAQHPAVNPAVTTAVTTASSPLLLLTPTPALAEALPSGTLTGSSTSRRQPESKRSWLVGLAIGGICAAIAVIGAFAFLHKGTEPAEEPVVEQAAPEPEAPPPEAIASPAHGASAPDPAPVPSAPAQSASGTRVDTSAAPTDSQVPKVPQNIKSRPPKPQPQPSNTPAHKRKHDMG